MVIEWWRNDPEVGRVQRENLFFLTKIQKKREKKLLKCVWREVFQRVEDGFSGLKYTYCLKKWLFFFSSFFCLYMGRVQQVVSEI
jgi:hypothetical protein